MQIVIMGVMGAGKTTVGTALAAKLGCPFYDADDFHPPENVVKLASGSPLSDDDRGPWIARVAALIRELHERRETAVIACSALTESVRTTLERASPGVIFVHLVAGASTIGQRLQRREGHFADPSLLASQFATLQFPQTALSINATGSPAEIVDEIIARLPAQSERM